MLYSHQNKVNIFYRNTIMSSSSDVPEISENWRPRTSSPKWEKRISQKSPETIDWKRKLEKETCIGLWNSRLTHKLLWVIIVPYTLPSSRVFSTIIIIKWKINWISYSIYFYERFYIFCIFRLTALKSFSRAVVFAIEAIDFRCCSSWNDTLYFPVCLCEHFLATTVTNALSSLNVYDQN